MALNGTLSDILIKRVADFQAPVINAAFKMTSQISLNFMLQAGLTISLLLKQSNSGTHLCMYWLEFIN
jgi:hypothetical protein